MPRNLHIVPSDLDTLRADILDVVNRMVDLIDEQDARIAALEAGQDAGHRHLDSFQPGGTGPHLILPEHVAGWLSRNQQESAA